jgi:hypothetical protein
MSGKTGPVSSATITSDIGLHVSVETASTDAAMFQMYHALWDTGVMAKLYKETGSTAACFLLATHYKSAFRDNRNRLLSAPGNDDLSELTNLSHRTIIRLHEVLQSKGLLVKVGEGRGKYGFSYNIFELVNLKVHKSHLRARADRARRREEIARQLGVEIQCDTGVTPEDSQRDVSGTLTPGEGAADVTHPPRLGDTPGSRMRDTGGIDSSASDAIEVSIRMLKDRGVGEPKRTELAAYPADVVVRYCRDFDIRSSVGQKKEPGWLIRAIESTRGEKPYAIHPKARESLDRDAARAKEAQVRQSAQAGGEEYRARLEQIDSELDDLPDKALSDLRYIACRDHGQPNLLEADPRTNAELRRLVVITLDLKRQITARR